MVVEESIARKINRETTAWTEGGSIASGTLTDEGTSCHLVCKNDNLVSSLRLSPRTAY
jgi:hypothetical protein